MKKLLILFVAAALFSGCEKDFDEIVDSNTDSDYSARIIDIAVPDTFSVSDAYGGMLVSATVQTLTGSDYVFAVLTDGDVNSVEIALSDSVINDNTKIFKGEFPMSGIGVGFYTVYFYLNGKKSASASVYMLGQNTPPIIFNLSMADTVVIGEEFVFGVEAYDEDGASDIAGVYYNVYDPDGNLVHNSDGISDFPLSDNGDTAVSGDEVANDQVYTMKLYFPSGVPTGDWKFDFFAIDRARAKSNIITHILTVQ